MILFYNNVTSCIINEVALIRIVMMIIHLTYFYLSIYYNLIDIFQVVWRD